MAQIAQPAEPASRVSTPEHATPHVGSWRSRAGHKHALQFLLVLVLGAVAAVILHRVLTRPTAVRVGSVVPGTVREETIGPGTVQSRYSVSLGSRVAGAIDSVLVDVGDEVQKGQLLATLDRTELEARSRATLETVASVRQDVALARASLAKARSDLDLARVQDRRAQALVGVGVSPIAEEDEARAALRAAQANERAARAALDARVAELARVVQERRVAEAVLSYTSLESPMAGIVTRRALEPGSAVAPGTTVLQIVDANALWVATLIDQSLAGRVKVGQRAIIHLRSGVETKGHVARIAFEADPVTREIEIDVAFDARPARFAIHEEADVTILGEEARGLTVPLEALSHAAGGTAVYIVENGRAQRRPIRLGVLGAKRAQVLEGVSEGDSVVVNPNAVRDGQRVAARGG